MDRQNKIQNIFRFARGERRALLWLLPLLAMAGVVLAAANRPRFEKSFLEQVDEQVAERTYERDDREVGGTEAVPVAPAPESPGTELFVFDPNEVTLRQLCRLGFTARTAAGIIKYRERGKVFEIPEDFATCYGVTLEHYTRLEPYIVIGERYRRPARVYPAYGREAGTPATRAPVELNTADSAALRGVSGIGEVLVVRIMDYRARLGGFAHAGQLREIPGVTPENYERIFEQISVDSCEIRKIDINFATHKTIADALGRHPYMRPEVLRKILSERQLKGGWSTIRDMVDSEILTEEQASRLAPYLVFSAEGTPEQL